MTNNGNGGSNGNGATMTLARSQVQARPQQHYPVRLAYSNLPPWQAKVDALHARISDLRNKLLALVKAVEDDDKKVDDDLYWAAIDKCVEEAVRVLKAEYARIKRH